MLAESVVSRLKYRWLPAGSCCALAALGHGQVSHPRRCAVAGRLPAVSSEQCALDCGTTSEKNFYIIIGCSLPYLIAFKTGYPILFVEHTQTQLKKTVH